MPSMRRWSVVLVAVAVLAALPWAIQHRPVPSSQISSSALLKLVQDSGSQQYSGYAEAVGGLAVPVTDQVSAVADLLGSRSSLRVWWRGPLDWRVDTVSTFGESDVHRDDAGTWTWNYEQLRATRTEIAPDVAVRLPTSSDLIPPELGRRLLSEATTAEVTRLPSKFVAGIAAAGIRLHPSQPQSSIDHVDMWVDATSGLPLRVDVYGAGSGNPAVTTTFLDFSRAEPSATDVTFIPPPSAREGTGTDLDLVSAANQFGRAQPPSSLAGIPRSSRTEILGSVGVYGRGVTELVATPLRGRFADPLRAQLIKAPGVVTDNERTEVGVGPLNLLLLADDRGGAWLLTGTVSPATLRAAASELTEVPVGRR
ncbi:MAG: hypothetical protein JWM76_274 [Pseudonocardiales bacterium]|nr:hypothetical protein [Pseudonocardiales bacterium]